MTFYRFNKKNLLLPVLFLAFIQAPVNAAFESINVVGSDIHSGLVLALHLAIKNKSSSISSKQREILEKEIIPHINQFVPNYKVISNDPTNSQVNIDVNVDMSAVQSAFALTIKNLNRRSVRAAVLVRGHSGGTPWKEVAYDEQEEALVSQIELEAKGRFQRRGITVLPRISTYQEHTEQIQDDSTGGAVMLGALAGKLNVDFILFIQTYFATGSAEGSKRKGVRLHIKGHLYDKNKNLLLANNEMSIPFPAGAAALKSKTGKIREATESLVERTLHDLFMKAGTTYLSSLSDSYIILRVQSPLNYMALKELRVEVAKISRIKSILEREVRIGSFDFWVDTTLPSQAFQKKLRKLNLENFHISHIKSEKQLNKSIITIKMRKKLEESMQREE